LNFFKDDRSFVLEILQQNGMVLKFLRMISIKIARL
jgi:hypothetical protein